MAAVLIAATVVIQALFMSAGLNTFKRIEENKPGAHDHRPATTTVLWILFNPKADVRSVKRKATSSPWRNVPKPLLQTRPKRPLLG